MNKTLIIGTRSVRISWDDSNLNEIMYLMFTPWNGESTSSEFDISVISENNGYMLQTPNESIFCYNLNDLIAQLEYAITLLSQKILAEYIQIHAATIALHGQGIALVGGHGSGKSTLALTAISCGLKTLTDDVTILDINKKQAIGFPRPIKATENTINLTPAVIPNNCPVFSVSNDTHYVFFHIPPGQYYSENAQLKKIVFLNRTDTEARLRDIGELEATERIITQVFNFMQGKDSYIEDIVQLIRNTSPCELSYKNNQDAIQLLKNIVQ